MVCSADQLASSAGLGALDRGGTAADAAIAANAVLAVTAPHLCGMGGDLFAIVHEGSGRPHVLNASGRAGSGADPERLRAEGHRSMPLRDDVRAAPVPGCVDGWVALHQRHGRLPLGEVLAPARRLAAGGFPASTLLAAAAPLLAGVAGAGDLTAGAPYPPGHVVRRPGVARVLDLVAALGRDGFYGGEVGAALLEAGAGEYAESDLARPQADWVDALGLRAWGHDLWTVPPNSQGYLTLAGAWIADGLPLPDDPDDPEWAHLLIEAARQAGHDRPAVLHEHADGAGLIAPERLAPRRAAVDPARAGPGPAPTAAGDTTYLCAVDGAGTAVSLIQSNASGFGCHVAIGDTGVLLHDRGIGFSLEPGHPAEYGPGRRPPHTLAPALVTGPDGGLRLVIGTMGGDSQPQILLQLIARVLVARQSPARAVTAGRWVLAGTGSDGFDTWLRPDRVRVRVEANAPPSWAGELERLGHTVERLPAFDSRVGHAQLIDAGGASLAGAADPRSGAAAALGR
ncbi:MAG: gamma-glutamyltransferase [Acidimicrobiales bacterium]|nr:gamma-glutamyltransferase [Acidimicrobiales bacterium]